MAVVQNSCHTKPPVQELLTLTLDVPTGVVIVNATSEFDTSLTPSSMSYNVTLLLSKKKVALLAAGHGNMTIDLALVSTTQVLLWPIGPIACQITS